MTYGCSTWLAARDLTVSTTAVTVSPTESHLQVTVQVRNDGSHDGVVWMGSTDGTGIRVSDLVLTVPAHATASADLSVDLDTCWTWDASSTPLTTTDTPLPLLGAVGVDQPLPADALPTAQGVTGLVLAPARGAPCRTRSCRLAVGSPRRCCPPACTPASTWSAPRR